MEISDLTKIIIVLFVFVLSVAILYNFIKAINYEGRFSCKIGYAVAGVIKLYSPESLLRDTSFSISKMVMLAFISKLIEKHVDPWASLPIKLYTLEEFIAHQVQMYKRCEYYNCKHPSSIFIVNPLVELEIALSKVSKQILQVSCPTKGVIFNVSYDKVDCNYLKTKLKRTFIEYYKKKYGECSNNNIYWRKLYFHTRLIEYIARTIGESALTYTGIDYPHYVIYITDGTDIQMTEKDLACLWYNYKSKLVPHYPDRYRYDYVLNDYCIEKIKKADSVKEDLIVSNDYSVISSGKQLVYIIYLGNKKVLVASQNI